MATYDSMISRAVGGPDALVPEPLSNEIFQELPKQSAAMALMRKTQLSSKTQRLPVLDVLPTAYWVGGDTGLKQTSDQAWKGIALIVEELATIIPVPEAYLADADVPIWSEVQPRMVEAVGALIDSAVLWGVGKPTTWGTDIYTAAVAAGNTIKDGYVDSRRRVTTTAATDFGQSVTALGDLMSQTGYTVSGFASRPGLNWRLIGLRSTQGVPIYQPDMLNGARRQPLRVPAEHGRERVVGRPRRRSSPATGPRPSSGFVRTSASRCSPKVSYRTMMAKSCLILCRMMRLRCV